MINRGPADPSLDSLLRATDNSLGLPRGSPNSGKVMDPDLAEAAAREVMALLDPASAQLDIPAFLRTQADQPAPLPSLVRDLASALNRHSAENASNTPDFILADLLRGCLDAFNKAVTARSKWYGREDEPGSSGPKELTPPSTLVTKDIAEVAIFQAIQNIKIGNKTDDKLILAELLKLGFWVSRLNSP